MLKRLLKNFIKAIFIRFGIILMKRSSRIYIPEKESYRIAIEQCSSDVKLIIDGGAHTGGSVDSFRKYAPTAKFLCFEPDPQIANILSKKFVNDKNVCIFVSALGDKNEKHNLNINSERSTNSLLMTTSGLQEDLSNLCRTVSRLDVTVASIDRHCEELGIDRVDVIKLDLQGYDYFALLGANKILHSTNVVLVEVLFKELYEGCHLFPDIVNLMIKNDFYLFTLVGMHYGLQDELLWADAIFVKKNNNSCDK